MLTYLEKLRGLREDNDLTQAQIASAVGTSLTMYARYKRSVNETPIRHLIALRKYYNVSADYLLDTAPNGKDAKKSAKNTASQICEAVFFGSDYS